MKVIVEEGIGGDGAKAGLYLDGGDLALKVTYPVAKVLQPVNDVIDSVVAKIEAAIPGDWDKAILDPIAAAAKAELLVLLTEAPAP